MWRFNMSKGPDVGVDEMDLGVNEESQDISTCIEQK